MTTGPIKSEAGRGAKADAGSARPKKATPGRSRSDIHTQQTEVHMPSETDMPSEIRRQLDTPTYNALARAIAAREKAAEQAGYATAVREFTAGLLTEKAAERPVEAPRMDWTLIICTGAMAAVIVIAGFVLGCFRP